ncbi:hypothetical protein F2Q70_00013938 [Brassica cretica]|uniref:non-specific serine/threonine protein kinase n=1 Tax=Brassica cretica TaxID=69181 RepID=A0A8S9M013_BRACR|nr:hypothetical protein F2Q70_00013938 [Brassica cretica]
MARQRRRSLCLLITVWFLSDSVHVVRAQNRTGATTDPDEARALNSIFAAWRIPAPREWNISGELCSGVAMDDSVTIDDKAYNPLIKCDCTFNSSKICRITALKVYASEVVGPIPPQLWTLHYLTNLNLGQNVLTGSLPPAIGNLTRMQYMTFGINALSGPVPKEIGLLKDLRSLDVSYNDLSGSLPSWVNLPNLKLNLVANNFSLEGLDKSVLPGLSCLQKDFPCNRGKALYSEFSINCGGPPIRSVSGALFEREDEELGPASFVVSDVQRWAASSVGLFAGSSSNVYTATSQSQFINTLDSELFQSARLSASSLRYYGLGLENGGYTVTLQFAEIQILGSTSNTWRGLGRRRFDIYVQGRLVETDFDVRRTAGDSTVRAVQRVYKANVTENHLEIHLFWAGKGTCCIPIQGAYGPLISAVSAKSDFTPTVGNRPPSKGKNRTGTIVGVIVGVGLLSILAGVAIFIIRKRRKRYTDDEELLSMDVKPYTFTYSELKSATQDFDPSNKLGEGGFGPVYKGKLNDGRDVAAKLLSVGSRQGKGQFVAEIVAISAVQHRNLVKLYGCCYEGDHRLLVYEYLPNGSLDQALFGDKTLHLDCGYLAPEYAMRGHLSEKTDVYAFGVVALELVSGRPNSDENLEDEKRYLLEWAWNLHEKSREVELIDRELTEFNMEEVKRMIGIALLCTQTSHALRPPMSRVVAMLSGDVEVSDVTSKPGYLTDWRFDDTTSSSLSGFQTKETWASDSLSTSFVAPGSEISPGSADSKPMLGVKINEGR